MQMEFLVNIQGLKNEYVGRQNDKRALLLELLTQILILGNIIRKMSEE
jgi:hypothetical protein